MSNSTPFSGTDLRWLGPIIPETWEKKRAKWLFEKMSRPAREEDNVVTCFRDGEVTLRINRRTDGFTEALKEIGYQGVRSGDLVISAMDAFAGSIGVSDSDGKCTPVYAVCQPKKDSDANFYSLIVREMARSQWIIALARGIRERSTDFRYESFRNQHLPVPKLAEQQRIVAYLNEATAKVDRLVTLRQRQMELLQEQRVALIQQAVTRGLNPRATFKDSGIPWLGEIPKHWQVKKLKFLCNVITGGKDTINAEPDGEFPFFVRSQIIERINSHAFDGEAVLTAGDGAGVGKVFHYYNGKLDFHQRVYLLHNFRHVTGRFFFQYLRSLFHSVALGGQAKSTVDSLRMDIFLNFEFCVPPATEQAKILEWIEQQEMRFDALQRFYTRQIELLTEYRAALIHECVTGQREIPQTHVRVTNQTATATNAHESTAGKHTANVHFKRAVLGAEIIHRLHGEPTFGRVKLEKIIYLSETYAEIDLEGRYQRAAAGPFDNRALRSVEAQIQRQKWYQPIKGDKGTRYLPLEKAGTHQSYFEKYWTEQRPRFERIIELLQTLKTENCEIIATLFAVWNDRLRANQTFSDDSLVDEVLTNWHPNKQKIARERWLKALQWMREKDLIPSRQN